MLLEASRDLRPGMCLLTTIKYVNIEAKFILIHETRYFCIHQHKTAVQWVCDVYSEYSVVYSVVYTHL